MGFKHARSGFGTVHVGTVVAHSALCRGGHFVTICKVSFHKTFFSRLFRIFWDSVESNKKEGGSEFCSHRKLLERRM